MATVIKDIWLRVLIGFMFTLLILIATAGSSEFDGKLDKDVFEMHEEYQRQQFGDIKDSLTRIENKM